MEAKPVWKVWGEIVACLCVAAILILATPLMNSDRQPDGVIAVEQVYIASRRGAICGAC